VAVVTRAARRSGVTIRPDAGADGAAAVRYLVSDATRFVTGAQLVVDGGLTARSPEWATHGTQQQGRG
jgi:NAD(P)-dependent dehydrogenase (short-subunit alcohol dehydrogenase family)